MFSDQEVFKRFVLAGVAEINPDTLSASTPADYSFRYIDLSAAHQGKINWLETQQLNFSDAPSRARRIVRQGDCLFGTVRPALRSHGFIGTEQQNLIASTGFSVVRARPGVLFPRFLYHWLLSADALKQSEKLAIGSNYPAVNESDIRKLMIPVPSDSEQQRIAEILDTLDIQIQASTTAISKLAEVRNDMVRNTMASGLELFREAEASELYRMERLNRGPWSLVPLGSLLSGIDAGNSPDLEDIAAGPDQWGVLKVSAVGNGVFRAQENKVAPDRFLHNAAICVQPGDILMTRSNTPQLVGLSCIVQDTPPHLMLCDKTLRLRVTHPYATTDYVQIILGIDEVRRQIEIAATGTSGSMKNISQHAIRKLMIPMGNAADIMRVVEVESTIKNRIETERSELKKLQLLKQGLMDDLLTGRVRVTDGGMERMGAG